MAPSIMAGIYCCFLLVALATTSLGEPIVDTKYGPVEGHAVDLDDGSYVNSFLGVPFAKPPVNELRWQPPEEPDNWDLFVADELRSVCIQNILGSLQYTHRGWNDFSEDCLHMNIYSPQDMNGGPYPVMVYFHGGGYQDSANIQYPGHFLARKGVVVVVPNYRLGIFGFASTGDEVAPGNYGMLDQLQALKFVQENIANFGGDPDLVTIFGQSAGAGSVGLHMMSPLSRDYFHQAIQQSGSELAAWAINTAAVEPHTWIHQIAESHDCESDNNTAVMDCLREVGPWRLHRTNFNCSFCLGFAPVVDGPDGFLPDNPWLVRQSGDFADVPLMSGITREDGFYYALIFGIGNLTHFEGLSREEFETAMWLLISMFDFLYEDAHMKEQVYEAVMFYYSPWPYLDDEPANLHEVGMLITDFGFGFATDQVLKFHSQAADSYNYVFGFRGSNHGELLPEWMGVPHILDLPYTFGFPYLKTNPLVRNDTQMFIDPIDWTEEDAVIADFTMDLWTNFAKYGNPTPKPIETPLGSVVTWEEFTNETLNYFYLSNEAMELREDYRQRDYAFWTYYLRNMVLGELGANDVPLSIINNEALEEYMLFLADRLDGEYD